MRIVIDSDIPFLDEVFNPWAEVVRLPGEAIGRADARTADALLVRTRTHCDSALLTGSRVRFIGTATVGDDHIDTAWCAAHGIAVATAAGSNSRGVLQWVAAALAWLAENRGGKNGVENGAFRGLTPGKTTLGVVGVGNVGRLVVDYARGWGFNVICSDPPRERAERLGRAEGFYPLEGLAAACDVVTFHVPLTTAGPDATCHMVGDDFVSRMRDNAVILNASRGAVIDPEALVRFADRAIIDTWNDEPAIDRTVLDRVLLATPHIAGYTQEGKAAASAMIINALAREFKLPLTVPARLPRSEPREIGWAEMCSLMPRYFDIAAQSAALKSAPERFEWFRNNYKHRKEFF